MKVQSTVDIWPCDLEKIEIIRACCALLFKTGFCCNCCAAVKQRLSWKKGVSGRENEPETSASNSHVGPESVCLNMCMSVS